jgi:hypothetical protein
MTHPNPFKHPLRILHLQNGSLSIRNRLNPLASPPLLQFFNRQLLSMAQHAIRQAAIRFLHHHPRPLPIQTTGNQPRHYGQINVRKGKGLNGRPMFHHLAQHHFRHWLFATLTAYDMKRGHGKGSYGTVFLAEHRQTREQLAVKLLGLNPGPSNQQSLLREMEALIGSNHPALLSHSLEFACVGQRCSQFRRLLPHICRMVHMSR